MASEPGSPLKGVGVSRIYLRPGPAAPQAGDCELKIMCKTLTMGKLQLIVAFLAVAVLAGHSGTERRADTEPKIKSWPNSDAAQVLARACGNCHSNQTNWPWYSHVPPVSWWIARHVHDGREKLDFSRWDVYSLREKREKLESICGLILTKRMPPPLYAAIHSEANLSESDKKAVCAWVQEPTEAGDAQSVPNIK